MYQIGIDIGGTFTDAAVIGPNGGRAILAKSPTTPGDYLQGTLAALEDAARQLGISLQELLAATTLLAHSTTVTSNVLWTRTGPRVGLIATGGFGDQILIMRGIGRVAGLSLAERRHYRRTDKPAPLVPRKLIREMDERVDSAGEIIVPLDEEKARSALRSLVEDEKAEALAVGLLWSFRNPAHEKRIKALAAEEVPGIPVSLSSEVSGRLGEYERTATAVLNAYVADAMAGYLEQLIARLREEGLKKPPLIVQSNGGLTPIDRVVPIRTVESGPAVGVVGAARLSDELGKPNLIATDVGGTTFKVAHIQEGRWDLADETILTQYHVHVPMVEVFSIGAGGGSIAWEDEGRLRVGPRSAGAVPGPACYGTGGEAPTVTDADLLLGVLNPENFLGGQIHLDTGAARQAFENKIAPRFFGGDAAEAAAGVRHIIDAQMADLLRKITLEKGRDPREFTLLAYGGAGPAHACAYAAETGIAEVIVPYYATVLSAFGAAASGVRYTVERSKSIPLPEGAPDAAAVFGELEHEGGALLSQAGVSSKEQHFERWCAIRWRRQIHSISIPFPAGGVNEALLEKVAEDFSAVYAARYGKEAAYTEAGVEITRLWIQATGPALPVQKTAAPARGAKAAPHSERRVFWGLNRGWAPTPIYEGPALPEASEIEGPAIIEHPGTTIALPPEARAITDSAGHTHIRLTLAAPEERP